MSLGTDEELNELISQGSQEKNLTLEETLREIESDFQA